MNKHLKELIEIANLDCEINSFEPRIQEARKDIVALETKRAEKDAQIEELQDKSKDTKLSLQKSEGHLADLSQKLEDIAKKTKLVKTEKENKALALEEELAKEQITFANEEIQRYGTQIKQIEEQIQGLQQEIAEITKQEESIQGETQAKVDKIKEAQKEVFNKKEALIAKMDQKIIRFYEKIKKWAKDTSVVPVTRQACGGCFIRLNDRVYSDVIGSDEIITCPHCGRILYNPLPKEATA